MPCLMLNRCSLLCGLEFYRSFLYLLVAQSAAWVEVALSLNVLFFECAGLERQVVFVLGFYDNLHAYERIVLSQVDDVLVFQSDAALAGSARHALLVVSAAVYADSLVRVGQQAQEVVAVALYSAASLISVILKGWSIVQCGVFMSPLCCLLPFFWLKAQS